jgi:2-alkyl-3-oxoalkanoate reductase
VRVLVTGASGMLGRATATGLLERGDEVTVLQRGPSGLPCREVLGDVADPAVVGRAVRGQDAVLHLAAKVDVTGPWAEYVTANVDGTRTVVDACRTADVGRLVHVSSPSVAHAGTALAGVGAGPADPGHARGRYARSKAMAELDALAADSPALAVLAVRPHLVWGPGDTQLVGRVVARARAGRLPVIGSGAALIDTTYVDNAAAALVAAVDACGPVHGEALVVSNGEPRPVAEVVGRLCRAAGVPVPHRRVPLGAAYAVGAAVEGFWAVTGRRQVPPITRFLAEQLATAHWFDQRRTRTALGWRPRVGLDEGFSRLRAWYLGTAGPAVAVRADRPPHPSPAAPAS